MLYKQTIYSGEQDNVLFMLRQKMPAQRQPLSFRLQRISARPSSVTDPILFKIRRLIEESPQEDLLVEDLPKIALCSQVQLYRKIKKGTGLSPSRFICHIRLEIALKLLQTTQRTINDIALSVGFNDPKYFCRVFRREFNRAPSAVRKNINKYQNERCVHF